MKRNLKNHPDLPKDFSLESLRDQNPFGVPDGYFDELPQIIKNRIEANPVIINKSRRIHPGVFAAAASVVLLLGFALMFRAMLFNDSSTEIQLAAISDTHIVSHLDSVIANGELDEPILMDVVAEVTAKEESAATTSNSTTSVKSVETGILPTVSDEAIIEYLVLNQSPSNTTNDIAQKVE
jgi:hypothetical protein